jgi:hypothetical protein
MVNTKIKMLQKLFSKIQTMLNSSFTATMQRPEEYSLYEKEVLKVRKTPVFLF